MNPVESAAMWKLYSKSDDAISIKSTSGQLDNCVGGESPIGIVKYVNYENQVIPEGSFLVLSI